LTLACQAEFGTPSRMCRSTEVLTTTAVPPELSGTAWVMPTYKPLSSNISGHQRAMDASGQSVNNPNDMSCFGWSFASVQGLTTDGSGRFRVNSCAEPHPIACCALVP
jgi:hypothetical protein